MSPNFNGSGDGVRGAWSIPPLLFGNWYKIPEWLPTTSQATRLWVACGALWPRKSKDSRDCGLSGKQGGEKAEGSPPFAVSLRRMERQNAEIRGKRAEVNRPSRERGCSERIAGGGQGGWPARNSCGWCCQPPMSWLALRNSMGPTGG